MNIKKTAALKFVGFSIMAVLLQLSISGLSQSLTFSGKDVALKEVFAVIKTQTGVLFFYDASLLSGAKPVTVNWKNVSLETALDEIFKEQPITWSLGDKTVTVIKRPGQTADLSASA